MKKGQLTLEYLLMLAVLLILFTSISMELMDFSSEETLQIQTEQMKEIHGSTLINNAESLSLQAPGAKQSITVTAPPDCGYQVGENIIELDCSVDTSSEEYDGDILGDIEDIENVEYLPEETSEISAGQTDEIKMMVRF